jgi:hypothetical protein
VTETARSAMRVVVVVLLLLLRLGGGLVILLCNTLCIFPAHATATILQPSSQATATILQRSSGFASTSFGTFDHLSETMGYDGAKATDRGGAPICTRRL